MRNGGLEQGKRVGGRVWWRHGFFLNFAASILGVWGLDRYRGRTETLRKGEVKLVFGELIDQGPGFGLVDITLR